MTDERNWRESRAPQWVKDAAQAEIDAYRIKAALQWPTEARPEPVPFRWGDYDRLTGDPEPGVYWSASRASPERLEIAKSADIGRESWRNFSFRLDARDWSYSPERGPLFRTKREARLHLLWEECNAAARTLAQHIRYMERDE